MGPLTMPRGARKRRIARVYPFEITCPSCDIRLLAVNREWLVFVGPQPVEFVGLPNGDVTIVCARCGTLVALDRELVRMS